jgi:hypothetical protein
MRRRQSNGWIAAGATTLAAIMVLIELLRLAPGERVDVPYLTTFPYADLAIRLDGLSLAFALITLTTAALLMLMRQRDTKDRRDPWLGWLLTSTAACALLLAANLLLVYVLLQVLTLAWSGALDETAPRRLRLRLTLQVADIGLLLAAASAIQSVGTSSFSGVPSDTFGAASFWLMLLPVVVRIGALASVSRPSVAAVLFGPAIAWLAPAGYLVMRLLALMGGRLPDRPTAVILFSLGAVAAILFGVTALWARSAASLSSLLLAAQASVALALSAAGEPLLTVACTWLWLLLVPLGGLVSVRIERHSTAEALARFQLSMLPASIAFTAVFLGALTLNAAGLTAGIVPLVLVVLVAASAALRRVRWPRALPSSLPGAWGVALLLVAAVPGPVMTAIVVPAASTVRPVPAGTVSWNVIGLSTAFGFWPALVVSVLVTGGAALAGRFVRELPAMGMIARLPVQRLMGIRLAKPRLWHAASRYRWLGGRWPLAGLWGAFALVLLIALVRP